MIKGGMTYYKILCPKCGGAGYEYRKCGGAGYEYQEKLDEKKCLCCAGIGMMPIPLEELLGLGYDYLVGYNQ